MRRFKKRSDLAMVFIPGRGRLRDADVLVGDDFARFCPSLLSELPQVEVLTEGLVEVSSQAVAALPVLSSSVEPAALSGPLPDKSWSRRALAEFAVELGVKTTGMTKTELLAAIQRIRS
jgi:hypothetical protein